MHLYNYKDREQLPPEEWTYKYVLNLNKEMDGSDIRVYSVFNAERTPSMFLYVKNGRYRWTDHSSGNSGDVYDLVKALMEMSSGNVVYHPQVIKHVMEEYTKWKSEKGEFIPTKLNVHKYEYDAAYEYSAKEDFSELDLRYWASFGIEPKLLHEYNIKSLNWFKIGRRYSGGTVWNHGITSLNYSYGFFEEDGQTLIKIYNPHYNDLKHINVKNDFLGRAQLDSNRNRTLIICSSMKDMLTLKSLAIEVDVIAPIGEKVIIKKEDIDDLKELYTNILTLFDNDRTGIKAMQLYKDIYNIDFVYLPFYKDISEFRASTDYKTVLTEAVTRINKKIFKYNLNESHKEEKGNINWSREGIIKA